MVGGNVAAIATNRGLLSCGQVVIACGGMNYEVALKAGIELPIRCYPLQAMVTLQPSSHGWTSWCPRSACTPTWCNSCAARSSSGAALDPYQLLDPLDPRHERAFGRGRGPPLPVPARGADFRQWAGITDMTPDYSPIMGRSPLDNLWLDCGWGTWGLKATPVAGKRIAECVATGHVPEILQPFALERFEKLRPSQRDGRDGGVRLAMKLLTCPLNGPRNIEEFQYLGPVRAEADPQTLSDREWARHLFRAENRPGLMLEWWRHTPSNTIVPCRYKQGQPTPTWTFESRPTARRTAFPPVRQQDRSVAAASLYLRGRSFQGYAGDTIASALAANGQWMLSRSFKYHRPRGAWSMAGAEANTLVQLPDEPNVAADLTPLRDGMKVTAQNVNGTLARDRDAVIDRMSRFLPVGFDHRTFMGPTRNAWLKVWEPMIRRKAGLGTVSLDAPHRAFGKAYLHCDILVVGAGPAGLSAAIEAATAGADVILCDEQPELGGSLTFAPQADTDLAGLLAKVQASGSVRVMTSTLCNGWFEDNWLPLIAGATLARAGQPGDPRDGRHRAAGSVSQQRPARHSGRRRGAKVDPSLRRASRAPRCGHGRHPPLRWRSRKTSSTPGWRSPPSFCSASCRSAKNLSSWPGRPERRL